MNWTFIDLPEGLHLMTHNSANSEMVVLTTRLFLSLQAKFHSDQYIQMACLFGRIFSTDAYVKKFKKVNSRIRSLATVRLLLQLEKNQKYNGVILYN